MCSSWKINLKTLRSKIPHFVRQAGRQANVFHSLADNRTTAAKIVKQTNKQADFALENFNGVSETIRLDKKSHPARHCKINLDGK